MLFFYIYYISIIISFLSDLIIELASTCIILFLIAVLIKYVLNKLTNSMEGNYAFKA
jgi:hypothetical protein